MNKKLLIPLIAVGAILIAGMGALHALQLML